MINTILSPEEFQKELEKINQQFRELVQKSGIETNQDQIQLEKAKKEIEERNKIIYEVSHATVAVDFDDVLNFEIFKNIVEIPKTTVVQNKTFKIEIEEKTYRLKMNGNITMQDSLLVAQCVLQHD